MKKKSVLLIISVILVITMSFSFVAYAGDHDTPILPIPSGGSTDNPTPGSGGSDSDWETPLVPVPRPESETTKTSVSKCTVSGIKNKVYTGKALTQSPTVKYGKKVLKAGSDYTLAYSANKKVGVATVSIKGKGAYNGSVKKTFKIIPKATKLNKVTSPKSKQLKATWKKLTTQTTGYQIQYSTNKSFKKGNKTVTVTKNKTTSKTIKKLKSKKVYYVRIRTYKTVNKTKIYSNWSALKKIKVK